MEEAPVYYPNEKEFKNPLLYIEKIRLEAEQYGICKIVPPKSWNPTFALDPNVPLPIDRPLILDCRHFGSRQESK